MTVLSKLLAQGRWLALHEIEFRDVHGCPKTWECVRRVAGSGAASIVATVERDGEPHLVVVKQYRPPLDGYVLELPAGLIDAGEDVGETAARELEEETGFRGKITEIGPFIHNSPGLSDEKVAVVRVDVQEQVEARPEADESIEVVTFPIRGLKERLLLEKERGVLLDSKLWCFALGLDFGHSG